MSLQVNSNYRPKLGHRGVDFGFAFGSLPSRFVLSTRFFRPARFVV